MGHHKKSKKRTGSRQVAPATMTKDTVIAVLDAAATAIGASVTALREMAKQIQERIGGEETPTLGPVQLPWSALIHVVAAETQLTLTQAAEALNRPKSHPYAPRKNGTEP